MILIETVAVCKHVAINLCQLQLTTYVSKSVETDKLCQRVWEVILSKKSHGPIQLRYCNMDQNDYRLSYDVID
jgi:hypothetical protein